jgi:hypothetical protein
MAKMTARSITTNKPIDPKKTYRRYRLIEPSEGSPSHRLKLCGAERNISNGPPEVLAAAKLGSGNGVILP